MNDEQTFQMQAPAAAPVAGGEAPLPLPSLKVSDSITYTLEYPIVDPTGFEIKTLKLRRLKAREMKDIDLQKADGKFGTSLKFIAAMNDLPDSVFEELDAVDVIALVGASAPFLVRTTGAAPSS